jgi:hypothetical protein
MKEVSFTLNQKRKVAGRGYLPFSRHFARQLPRSIESPRRGKRFTDFCVGAPLVEVGMENEFGLFTMQNIKIPYAKNDCHLLL